VVRGGGRGGRGWWGRFSIDSAEGENGADGVENDTEGGKEKISCVVLDTCVNSHFTF